MAIALMAIAERESGILREELWRFSKDQYHRLADMGWFLDTRVELMAGVVVEKYPDTPTGEPRSLPWTIAQYHQIALIGWFGDARVELIEGDILTMPPIGTQHMTSVMLASQALQIVFGGDHAISVQTHSMLEFGRSRSRILQFCPARFGTIRIRCRRKLC